MENVGTKPSSREKKRNESEKCSKKEKQGKSNVPGTKSRKKTAKSHSTKQTNSKTSMDVKSQNEAESKESELPSENKNLSRVTRDKVVVDEVDRAASGDSSRKRDKSKSRSRSGSRSGSRSRFSGFFRRKRYSMSETDLNKSSKNGEEKRSESAESISARNRTSTHRFNNELDENGSTTHLRSNLKTTPVHHFYNSRIQPRDRLLHMTVADAVKEQRLRRGNSVHRYQRSQGPTEKVSHIMSMSSPSLAATMVGYEVPRQESVDATPSSILTPLKRKQKSDEVIRPSFKHLQPLRPPDKHDRLDSTPKEGVTEASSVDNSRLDQNSSHKDIPRSNESTNASVDSKKRKQTEKITSDNDDNMHKKYDVAEGQSILNARPPHQVEGAQKIRRQSSSPFNRMSIEEAKEAKLKRKESLSKFLELRQTLPSSISRSHRLSQSSDSGVTSRDTSPSAPLVPIDVIKRQPEKILPSHELQLPDKSVNPYVLNSVSISPVLITAPRVSITGSQLDVKSDPTPAPKNRPNFIKLDDSMGESSSVSSSPQINSMTSSFRSSDQGYVNSDSDDDNASFSTPPEEVDPGTPGKRERIARTFNPTILEKLLETSRDQKQRGLFPELDLDNWDTKRGRLFTKAENDLEEVKLPKERFRGKVKGVEAEPKYVPRGVRRSKSDVDSRYKPTGAIHRQTSDEQRPRTGSTDAFKTSPNFGSERVKFDLDRLSAASTSTLVVQDEVGVLNGDHVFTEHSDHKLVPVMGTVAQQKYRRTYSPSRIRKLIPPSKDEIHAPPESLAPPSRIYPERSSLPSSQTSDQSIPVQEQPEKLHLLSTTKLEPSPFSHRKGILKSPVKNRECSISETRPNETPTSETFTELPPTLETDVKTKSENTEKSKTEISVKIPRKSHKQTDMSSKSETIVSTPQKSINNIEGSSKTEINLTASQKSENIIEKPSKTEVSITSTSKADISIEGSSKTEIGVTTIDLSETSIEVPLKTEISHKSAGKDSIPFIPVSINVYDVDASLASTSPVSNTTVDHHTTPTVSEEKLDVSKKKCVDISPNFPLIHGLEVGIHKVHSFSGYSLTDYLKEQSKVNKKVEPQGRGTKSKDTKSSRASAKKKNETDKQSSQSKLDKKKMASQELKPSPSSDQALQETDDSNLKIMIDKECQTSAWLINALIKKKTSKPKKKLSSFSKKRKPQRRGSTVSDTFIPTNVTRHKESHQRSSLGDIRLACAAMASFTTDTDRGTVLPDRITRGASEKSISRSTKQKRQGEVVTRHEPILPGSSLRSNTAECNDGSSELPKPKKLSLAAVILLKNRLAKYREKKKCEKSSVDDTPDDDTSVHSVGSDTLITIENELNLSKLEVSKETDIIDDDDIYEPEFMLGYTRKQLRFESIPSTEAIQSEEPLPPLPLLTSRRMRQRRESTLRERRRKCVQYCKKFIAFLFSHVGLCSLVVAYTILGGFIFQLLEGNNEYTVRSSIRDQREVTVDKLVSLFFEFQKSEEGVDNFRTESNKTIQEYQLYIHRMTKDRGWDGVEGIDEVGLWTYASSLLYAITVTTTIGYGHVAPKTPEGRIVTIGYAVVGIPLTLLCLTNIGDVMATGFRFLYGKICCGVCCNIFKRRRRRIQVDLEKGLGGPIITSEEQPDKPKEVIHVPTSLCLLLIAGYIFAGAMLFSMWEQWDILTGSYFCFITLSTIGFGDIVPGMDSNAWAAEEKLVLCALYLVLGLSLIAMCFNLVQEDVKAKCRWLGMKLGIVDKHETPI